jgi:hypothetical protein
MRSLILVLAGLAALAVAGGFLLLAAIELQVVCPGYSQQNRP